MDYFTTLFILISLGGFYYFYNKIHNMEKHLELITETVRETIRPLNEAKDCIKDEPVSGSVEDESVDVSVEDEDEIEEVEECKTYHIYDQFDPQLIAMSIMKRDSHEFYDEVIEHGLDQEPEPVEIEVEPVEIKIEPVEVKVEPVEVKVEPGEVEVEEIEVEESKRPLVVVSDDEVETSYESYTLKELKEKMISIGGPKLKTKKDIIEYLSNSNI